ncbi:hypothetical protein AusDCA_1148 [Desulfitobacterium sp. AusDCA]
MLIRFFLLRFKAIKFETMEKKEENEKGQISIQSVHTDFGHEIL